MPSIRIRRDWNPLDVAVLNIRVVSAWFVAPVPVTVVRVVIAIVVILTDIDRVRVKRLRIVKPEVVEEPPPTEMSVMPVVTPCAVCPGFALLRREACDVVAIDERADRGRRCA